MAQVVVEAEGRVDPSLLRHDDVCPNCNTPGAGDYCAGCGQSLRIERLTLRTLFEEFARKFLNFERGLLRTIRDLTLRPGQTMRAYVEGQRRTYVNPFTYLVFGMAINLVANALTGTQGRMMEAYRDQFANDLEGSARRVEAMMTVLEVITQYNLYLMLLIALPFALLLRWFFADRGYVLAEIAVFPLYAFGHVALFGAFIAVAMVPLPFDMNVMMGVSFVTYVAYCAWAALGFFGRSWSTPVLSTAALVAGYGITMAVTTVGTIIYVAVTMLTGGSSMFAPGEDWNLLDAAEQDALGTMQALLEEGADVNMTRGVTPLHVAVEKGNLEMTALLLDHGADLDRRDFRNRTPLLIAIHEEHTEVAERLAEAGADPNVARDDGSTVLMEAIEHQHPTLAAWALEQGADPNARRDHAEATALMEAVSENDPALIELLLAHGADPHATNADGETALDRAEDPAVRAVLEAAMATAPGAGGEDS